MAGQGLLVGGLTDYPFASFFIFVLSLSFQIPSEEETKKYS
jgi:hypothetical protein